MKPKPPSPKKNLKPILMSALLAFVVVIVGIGFFIYNASGPNYAKEVAKPIEDALVKAGAVKMCERGDSGRGVDNREPWYESYYEISYPRDNTVELLNNISNANGYKLTHASKDNRNFRNSPPDELLDNWYFDNTNKPSRYSDLKAGNIELSFSVNNDGMHKISGISCGKKEAVTINSSQTSSMVTVSVRLPGYK